MVLRATPALDVGGTLPGVCGTVLAVCWVLRPGQDTPDRCTHRGAFHRQGEAALPQTEQLRVPLFSAPQAGRATRSSRMSLGPRGPGAWGLSHRPMVRSPDAPSLLSTVCEVHTKFVLALPGKKETKPHSVHFFSGRCCRSICGHSDAGDASLTPGFSVNGLNPLLPGLPVTASQFPGISETPLLSCTQCSWL